jgi:hypothetical protein
MFAFFPCNTLYLVQDTAQAITDQYCQEREIITSLSHRRNKPDMTGFGVLNEALWLLLSVAIIFLRKLQYGLSGFNRN